MITLFNRAISYLLIVGVLSASLALMNLVLQFSWLALLIFILTILMVFLIFQQESKIQNYDGDSIENKPIEDTDALESKVQERTLELNIALQELEDANKELQEKNTLDELTGLYNRRFYDQKIQAEFRRSRRNLTPLSLVVIDIDYFKKVNDNYGHLAGDECLYAVAQKLADTVSRPEDFVARYGGEEFVVLLPQTDKQGALFVAEQIQKAIEMLAIVHEDSFTGYLSVSMGINTVNHHQCDDHLTFIQAADDALYYAKNQGRNCIALSPGK